MTLDEIKQAVNNGYAVFWRNKAYVVEKTTQGEYLIHCTINGNCIGLTWQDGVTMNGNPEHFFIS